MSYDTLSLESKTAKNEHSNKQSKAKRKKSKALASIPKITKKDSLVSNLESPFLITLTTFYLLSLSQISRAIIS